MPAIYQGKLVIGIDPGVEGGIAVLEDGALRSLIKMPPTPLTMYKALRPYSYHRDTVCFVEKLHGMPGMSGTSMWTLGENCGLIAMALVAHQIKTIYVLPHKWQQFYEVGTKAQCSGTTEWKNILRDQAQALYPETPIYKWGSDALLIAYYGHKTT